MSSFPHSLFNLPIHDPIDEALSKYLVFETSWLLLPPWSQNKRYGAASDDCYSIAFLDEMRRYFNVTQSG
jgi:hypothetical protein